MVLPTRSGDLAQPRGPARVRRTTERVTGGVAYPPVTRSWSPAPRSYSTASSSGPPVPARSAGSVVPCGSSSTVRLPAGSSVDPAAAASCAGSRSVASGVCSDILPLLTDADPLGVDDFATHRIPLAEAPDAYATFQKKQDGMIKTLIQPKLG